MSATPQKKIVEDVPPDPSRSRTTDDIALRNAVIDMGRLAATAEHAMRAGGGGGSPPMSPVRAERIKLYATYLNTISAGFAVTGVVGPIANFLYGTTSPTIRSLWQLCVEVGVLIVFSLLLHLKARAVLGRLAA